MENSITYETFENIHEKSQMGELADPIIECITSAFGNEMPEDEVEGAFEGDLIMIAKNPEGEVIGYSATNRRKVSRYPYMPIFEGHEPTDAIYSLGSVVVDARYHGQGVFREFNRHMISSMLQEKVSLLGTYTQNPAVERGITSVLEEFVAQGFIQSYEIGRRKMDAFYERRLTSYPLNTQGTPFEELDIEAGDGFHIVFKLANN